ncbi:MAG: hypothetical protein N2508_13770 [Anaerolineae bacterium]|nr:hypothetical protein [Anaerolineae bacterium]
MTQLLQQWGDKLPAMVDQATQAGQASRSASSNAGNTAPGNFDPNKWDPSRFTFKSNSSLRSPFERHVLKSADEAWEEVLGVSRAQLEAARSDPAQLARLQEAYVQVGQQTSRAGNYIGVQAQGQQVFVDTSNRVVAIVQGDRFLSLYRIKEWKEFVLSMQDKGLQLAPGVTFEALQKAMGF